MLKMPRKFGLYKESKVKNRLILTCFLAICLASGGAMAGQKGKERRQAHREARHPDKPTAVLDNHTNVNLHADIKLAPEQHQQQGQSQEQHQQMQQELEVGPGALSPSATATGGTAKATGGTLNVEPGALSPSATATVEPGAVQVEANPTAKVEIAKDAIKTGDQIVNEGDITVKTGDVKPVQSTNITFEAQKPLAGVLHVGVPESPAVIQYDISRGSEERNLDAHAAWRDKCRPEYTRGNPIVTERIEDKKSKVVWEFQNHQNFTGERLMGLTTKVSMVLPEGSTRVDCLGTILAKSVDRKNSPGISVVEDDVYAFAGRMFGQCTTEVYLFSPEGATGANRGLQARSFAGNALESLTGIVRDGSGGLGGGFNGGRSNSFGAVQVGTTYWVLCEDPNGAVEMVNGKPEKEEVPPPAKTEPQGPPEPPKDAATAPLAKPVPGSRKSTGLQPEYRKPVL